jgi:hypothetical protein
MKTYTKDTPYSEIDMPTRFEDFPLWVRERLTFGIQPGDENLVFPLELLSSARTQERADMGKRCTEGDDHYLKALEI